MFDVAYLVRLLSLVWRSKKPSEQGNIALISEVKGKCGLADLDVNWHMNNARFLREADFGRFSLLMETGLWTSLLQRRKHPETKEANVIVSAIQVQYRQSLNWGETFLIRSRIDGWDDKAFFLEQQLIRQDNQRVACALLVRLVLLPRSLTPQMLVDQLHLSSSSSSSPSLSPAMELFRLNHRLNSQPIPSKI